MSEKEKGEMMAEEKINIRERRCYFFFFFGDNKVHTDPGNT